MSNESNKKEAAAVVEGPEPAAVSNETKILMIPLDQLYVPKERVTSVWDPAKEQEFVNSIIAKGILDPLSCMDIDGAIWVIDGLHRLLAAEKLKMSKVPCKIKKGSVDDLLIENLIMNRQRGKSNPAQEAEVLAHLVKKRNFPIETASKQMGFSLGWAKKLLRIAALPDQIKDLLKHGKIPITGAFYIADLPNPQQQVSVATDAAQWGYNVYQIKNRVAGLLSPDVEPEEGSYKFNSAGKPNKIPIRCRFCAHDLPDHGKQYIWVCGDCETLAADLLKRYFEALNEAPSNQPKQVRT